MYNKYLTTNYWILAWFIVILIIGQSLLSISLIKKVDPADMSKYQRDATTGKISNKTKENIFFNNLIIAYTSLTVLTLIFFLGVVGCFIINNYD
jgi:uncharacterized membrane protein SpoIIM required for sporulation